MEEYRQVVVYPPFRKGQSISFTGKLSKKFEAAGKVRVFAIAD